MPAATRVVGVGASSGGITAVQALLPAFAGSRQTAVVVVLHVHPETPPFLVLFESCGLPVREAEEKEELRPGTVYFAPPGYHLLVERSGTFSLSVDDPVCWARPSIDVLFSSLGAAYQERCWAVLLTGANHDGAEGCASISRRGGQVFVQDPEEAEVPAMPLAARQRCPEARVLSLEGLRRYVSGQVREGTL